MNTPIDQLVEELTTAAPELADRRDAVRAAVERLLADRPEAALDEAFRADLRQRLLAEFTARSGQTAKKDLHFAFNFSLSKRALAFGGTLGLVLAALLFTQGIGPKRAAPNQAASLAQDSAARPVALALGGQVTKVAAGAFGTLSLNGTPTNDTKNAVGAGEAAATNGATPLGAAQTPDRAQPTRGQQFAKAKASVAPTVAPSVAPDASPTAKTASSSLLMSFRYEATRHEYRYAGELTLPSAAVEVLKVERAADNGAVSSRLANLNLGLLDLGRFEQTRTQSLNLVEDREFGYSLNVDFQNGTAYVSQNWAKWPTNDGSQPALTADQLPPDAEAIAIAQSFARDYGLDLTRYGEPSVDKSWRRTVMPVGAAMDQPSYVPDRVTVRYPLLVNGLPVYDQSGYPQGLLISVDARLRKVTDAGPIAMQNYLASDYAPISDLAVVQTAILKGGVGRLTNEAAEKVVSHELEAPRQVLMQTWSYADGESVQLLVPALLFHVSGGEQIEGTEWYQEDVIVPLAKDLYVEKAPGPIMYMKGGGVTGSAGPATVEVAPLAR